MKMVCSCSAYGCTNRLKAASDSENRVTFHRFPHSKPELLKKWIVAVRRRNFIPKKHSYICSKHFEEECFKNDGVRRVLKKDSVPSIFNFLPRLIKVSKPRRVLHRQVTSNQNLPTKQKRLKNKFVTERCSINVDESNCTAMETENPRIKDGTVFENIHIPVKQKN